MTGPRWLASPLAGTATVLAGLCVLAIPLCKLTSQEPAPPWHATQTVPGSGEIPAVLRLRLLAPAKHLTVQTAAGKILLDLRNPAAGESEHDAVIPLADNGLDLTLLADFGDGGSETAVFLTVMPDGYADQTRYAVGNGRMEAPLRYEWHLN